MVVSCLVPFAMAQGQVKFVPLKTNGSLASASIVAGEQVSEVVFYAISPGNMTVPFSFNVGGPVGSRIDIKATVSKRKVQDSLNATSGWWDVPLDRDKLVIKAKSSYQLAAQSYSCGSVDPELIQEIIQTFAMMGVQLTPEEVCRDFFGGGSGGGEIPLPDPTPGGGGGDTPAPLPVPGDYVDSRGFLQKDTCGTKPKSKYILAIRVDLTQIDPAFFQSGFQVNASLVVTPYRGDTASSIKPVSDGRFAPQPLLLMSSVGGLYYGGEWANVVKWNKKGGGKLIKKLPVEDYAYYKGMILTRILVGSVLTGGKATFELTNGYSVYSVCFKLVRSRQKVGGYP